MSFLAAVGTRQCAVQGVLFRDGSQRRNRARVPMADNNYRSYRSRAVGAARESDPVVPERASDPLAELARIIGRSDPPYSQATRTAPADEEPQAVEDSSADWAREEYAERDRQEEYYDSPPSADTDYESESAPDYHTEAYEPGPRDDRGARYQAPRAPVRSSRESPAWLSSGREEPHDPHEADVPEHDEQHPITADRLLALPALADAAADDRYDGEEQEHGQGGDRAYGAEDYYDEPPAARRRGGLIVVMAVLGLAVLGTAGAFAYRAMFGASVLPTLPPIIKAGNTPNKIMPSYGDAQASNTTSPKSANASGTEKLVSREEQPIDIQETPRTAPRVVSTIPIAPGGNPLPPGAAAAAAPTGLSPAPASPWPGPTVAAPPPPAAAAPAQAPNAAVASEPKKIHTVTIRADSGGEAAAAPPAASASRTAPRANMSAAKPGTAAPVDGGNQPLAIVPNAEASPQTSNRTRTAIARAPASGTSAASSGGYAVQVSSQRSQAEAQAVFRSLKAKFPNQLGGREPIVRRADLGPKGVYYRTLVGPFASMEEAASMCSSLKAAGGTCIVQRN